MNGLVWVLSSVPVPNARERMLAALKDAGARGKGEVDGRRVPTEQFFTSHLEVFDAATGKLLADKAIDAYGIHLIDDRRIMFYTSGPNDVAQLEIWEMTLKR